MGPLGFLAQLGSLTPETFLKFTGQKIILFSVFDSPQILFGVPRRDFVEYEKCYSQGHFCLD